MQPPSLKLGEHPKPIAQQSMVGYIVIAKVNVFMKDLSTSPSPNSATKFASSARSSWSLPFSITVRGRRQLQGKCIQREPVRFPNLVVNYNIG